MISEKALLRLVKPVARSFSLSLQWLPSGLRRDATLGYLLARLSDNIADSRVGIGAAQLELLQEMRVAPERVRGDDSRFPFFLKEEERRLQVAWGVLVRALMQSRRVELLKSTWGAILEGQMWDLRRKIEGRERKPMEWEEVVQYCELVAGSVGEFWVRLLESEGWVSAEKMDFLVIYGRKYGVGLQLVNLLRDRRCDFKNGRIYLKKDDIKRACLAVEEGLRAAEEIGGVVRGRRVRMATILPARIAGRMRPGFERRVRRGEVWVEGLKLLLGF